LKTGDFLKRALLTFVVVLAAYAVLYYLIEHRRVSAGPWQVTFTNAKTGVPAMIINQSALGITNVQIWFQADSGAQLHLQPVSAGPITVTFNVARKTPFDVPYGKCVFLDTVFLPGTVVFESFGHQIQLMPRVLTIDGAERIWVSSESVFLTNQPTKTE
jgi:hypothetical protein